MYKIAILGDKDTIMPFRTVGIDTFEIVENENVEIEIKRIIDNISETHAIIYIVETFYNKSKKIIDMYKNEVLPMIIVLPNNKTDLNIGMKIIDENVYKAIGTNIF